MRSSKNLNDRTYEEMIAEAIAQIPLYSNEWTNYNASDPGITMLENLTAFQVLQQEELNEVTSKIKLHLLKMVGFVPKKGKPAKVLLQAKSLSKEVLLLPNQQVKVGALPFELQQECVIGNGNLLGIYTKTWEGVTDHTVLLEPYQIPGGRYLFGEKPQQKNSLYFVLDRIPAPDTQLIIAIDIWEEFPRNPLKGTLDYACAKIGWSLLTEGGYVDLEVEDTTHHFLQSGALYFQIPQARGRISERFAKKGYLLRGTLQWADYDLAPKVQDVNGFLTQVIQKDTKSVVLSFRGAQKICIQNAAMEYGYVYVYVREAEGDYYAYTEQVEPGVLRSYEKRRLGYGQYELTFASEMNGNKSHQNVEDTIIVVCYTEEMMRHRQLGKVCGYDEQEFELTPFYHILPETFSLMTCKKDKEGIERYAFFTPDRSCEDALSYSLEGEEAKVVIQDCGLYEEAVLSIAGCSVFQGDQGNIRSNNEGIAAGDCVEYRFQNPSPGYGGAYTESVEQVRKRFVHDMRTPITIVTRADCEHIVRNIPGLSIHKVKAFCGTKGNTICLVVKPHSRERFPKLSPSYCNTIAQYLDEKRMLTTKIEIQQPSYIQINVNGIIYSKKHYTNANEKIQELLQSRLDYVTTDKAFGSLISYHEIYNAIERLECVESIYELSIMPDSMQYVAQSGLDLQLKDNCLCYLGNLNLEWNRNKG